MSLRRLFRKIKSTAEQGNPGTPMRRIEMRAFERKPGQWRLRGFHPTKGWRLYAK